jgi:hypothetical protein
MKRLYFGLSIFLAIACGSISDPNKKNGGETVATVSGALTGTSVPDGTHVAIVWKAGANKYAVGNDAAVIDGKFTMSLTAPPASYLFSADEDSSNDSTPPSAGNSGAGGDPTSDNTSSNVSPKNDTVSGGITEPLKGALAGFVVYVDKNGNGKLDISGEYASSTDEIIGGSKELYLAYLSGGGSLDYEKLRDKSGILPKAGFNLGWTEKERWLPLDVAELKIDAHAKLPSTVCYGGGVSSEDIPPTAVGVRKPSDESTSTADAGGDDYSSNYPSTDTPGLECTNNGYTWSVPPTPCEQPPPQPTPVGLCADDTYPTSWGCGMAPNGSSIPQGTMPPPGWPCPVGVADGGSAEAGQF